MSSTWDTPSNSQARERRCGVNEPIDTLGDALLREIARVRDEVLPCYVEIGAFGMLAANFMRADLDRASKAMIEEDIVAMVQVYESLKGYQL